MANVEVSKSKQVKIVSKTIDCILIGYANNGSVYRFLVHEFNIQDIHEGTIIKSRSVSFFQNIFPCKDKKIVISNKRTYETTNGTSTNNGEPMHSKRITS